MNFLKYIHNFILILILLFFLFISYNNFILYESFNFESSLKTHISEANNQKTGQKNEDDWFNSGGYGNEKMDQGVAGGIASRHKTRLYDRSGPTPDGRSWNGKDVDYKEIEDYLKGDGLPNKNNYKQKTAHGNVKAGEIYARWHKGNTAKWRAQQKANAELQNYKNNAWVEVQAYAKDKLDPVYAKSGGAKYPALPQYPKPLLWKVDRVFGIRTRIPWWKKEYKENAIKYIDKLAEDRQKIVDKEIEKNREIVAARQSSINEYADKQKIAQTELDELLKANKAYMDRMNSEEYKKNNADAYFEKKRDEEMKEINNNLNSSSNYLSNTNEDSIKVKNFNQSLNQDTDILANSVKDELDYMNKNTKLSNNNLITTPMNRIKNLASVSYF
jgi:hypothetical protein